MDLFSTLSSALRSSWRLVGFFLVTGWMNLRSRNSFTKETKTDGINDLLMILKLFSHESGGSTCVQRQRPYSLGFNLCMKAKPTPLNAYFCTEAGIFYFVKHCYVKNTWSYRDLAFKSPTVWLGRKERSGDPTKSVRRWALAAEGTSGKRNRRRGSWAWCRVLKSTFPWLGPVAAGRRVNRINKFIQSRPLSYKPFFCFQSDAREQQILPPFCSGKTVEG